MTLPIHQSDVELLLRVVTGTSMVALAEEAACTPPNISRKVKRIKERLSWTPCMTVEQIRQRAGAVRLAGRSTGPEVLKLIVERDQLKAENAGLRTGYEAYERVNAELKAECEALRKDAARYEWLRQARSGYIEVVEWIGPHATGMTGEDLDALLDAAMGKGEQS